MEKIEGLAITTDGKMFVSTDNDGVDDSSGEAFFWSIGKIRQACILYELGEDPKRKKFGCASPIQVIRNRCQEGCQDRILRSPFPKRDSSAQESL